MFEGLRKACYTKTIFIRREVRKEYDAEGNLVRETTVLQDGGLGQEEAEKKLEKMDKVSKKMDRIFNDMDDLFG